jgi:hypothetical protein
MVPIQKSWDGHKFLDLQFRPKKIYIILWTMFRHTVYSVFVKKFFCKCYRFLKKLCFEPKKVDEKSSNGHNFPQTEPNCKYLSILERSCYVEFEKNVTKKILGQKMNRVTSSIFFRNVQVQK